MTHKSFFYSLNFDPIQKIFFICNKKWSKKKQILLKLNQKQTNSFKNLLQINRKNLHLLQETNQNMKRVTERERLLIQRCFRLTSTSFTKNKKNSHIKKKNSLKRKKFAH